MHLAQDHEEPIKRKKIESIPPELRSYFNIADIEQVHAQVRCTQNTYYQEISIPSTLLPTLKLARKPSHKEYLALKQGLRETVAYIFSGYINYIKRLEPIHKDPVLSALVDLVCLDTIERYWDMPCSDKNHHSEPWGYLQHTFRVACAQAEKGMHWKPFNQYGIDHQQLRKKLKYVVFMHFIKGLFHDSYKIHLYYIKAKGLNGERIFNPLHISGQILDFKIAYPEIIEERWLNLTNHPGRLNSFEISMRLPDNCYKRIPQEYYKDLFDDFLNMSPIDFDKEDAFQSVISSKEILEKIDKGIYSYFTNEVENNPKKNVFSINEKWTAVRYEQFITKLMQAVDYKNKENLSLLMIENEQMFGFSNEEGKIIYALNMRVFLYNKNTSEYSENEMKIAFISTEFLTAIYKRALADCDTAYFLDVDMSKFSYLYSEMPSNVKMSFEDEKTIEEAPEVVESSTVESEQGVNSQSDNDTANDTQNSTEKSDDELKTDNSEDSVPKENIPMPIADVNDDAVINGKNDEVATTSVSDEYPFLEKLFERYLLSITDCNQMLDNEKGLAAINDKNLLYLRLDKIVSLFYDKITYDQDEKITTLSNFLKHNQYTTKRSDVEDIVIEDITYENIILIKEKKRTSFAFYNTFLAMQEENKNGKA